MPTCNCLCVCGGEMTLCAVIFEDAALVGILTHLGLPTAFPTLKPAQSPPHSLNAWKNAPLGYRIVTKDVVYFLQRTRLGGLKWKTALILHVKFKRSL